MSVAAMYYVPLMGKYSQYWHFVVQTILSLTKRSSFWNLFAVQIIIVQLDVFGNTMHIELKDGENRDESSSFDEE